jgi:hypothetical protein
MRNEQSSHDQLQICQKSEIQKEPEYQAGKNNIVGLSLNERASGKRIKQVVSEDDSFFPSFDLIDADRTIIADTTDNMVSSFFSNPSKAKSVFNFIVFF